MKWCPTSGGILWQKLPRSRSTRKVIPSLRHQKFGARRGKIVEQSGANSETRFNQIVVGDVTFREQGEIYLQSVFSRKRNPLRDTVSVEGALSKWVYPAIGDLPLSQVDNLTLKPLIEKMSGSLSDEQ